MLLDGELIFLKGGAITATAASKVIDTVKGGEAIGNELFLRVVCAESATAAGAATVQFQIRTSDSITGSGDSAALASPEVLLMTAPIGKDRLAAGAEVLCVRMPYGAKRYLDVNHVVTTGPLTAGKFTEFLSFEK